MLDRTAECDVLITGKLPKKLSALIRLAITDLEKVEKDPLYVIEMHDWHTPKYGHDGICAVCLAGAVMAKSLRADPGLELIPNQFDEDNSNALRALDRIRLGGVHEALIYLGVDHLDDIPRYRGVIPYDVDPAEFKINMLDLADKLERVGF